MGRADRAVERSGPDFEFEAPPVAVRDPGAAYEAEVTSALAGAMLDYSGTLDLRPGDWLTVAPRCTMVTGSVRSVSIRNF